MNFRGESEPGSRHRRSPGMGAGSGHRGTRARRSPGLDRRARLPDCPRVPMSIRPSRARSWRCSPMTSGGGPPGSCGRENGDGSPGAGRPSARSWADCWASRPESLRFRAAAVGKPELDRGPGVVEPLRFNVSHSAELGDHRRLPGPRGRRGHRAAPRRSRSPSGSSRRSSRRPSRMRSPRSPSRTPGGVPPGLDPQGGRAQGIRDGDLGTRRRNTRPGSARPPSRRDSRRRNPFARRSLVALGGRAAPGFRRGPGRRCRRNRRSAPARPPTRRRPARCPRTSARP